MKRFCSWLPAAFALALFSTCLWSGTATATAITPFAGNLNLLAPGLEYSLSPNNPATFVPDLYDMSNGAAFTHDYNFTVAPSLVTSTYVAITVPNPPFMGAPYIANL